MPDYDGTPARGPLRILDPANGLATRDPARMAAAIIASVDQEPAPCASCWDPTRSGTRSRLNERVAGFEAQTELAASTDCPPGE
jgi:hypothetical protein